MSQSKIHIDVRSPSEEIRILDMQGEITSAAEQALFAARGGAKTLLLNFSKVQFMDSLGAGLLITLSARVRKEGRLLAYGLNEPCRRAFALTHLDEVIGLFTDEARALDSL
jgi:anti-sigma B factor antagonist